MRISDWSSDVCSSDLAYAWNKHLPDGTIRHLFFKRGNLIAQPAARFLPLCRVNKLRCHRAIEIAALFKQRLHLRRSAEHTSELPSLLRISFAVSYLKTQNTSHPSHSHDIHTTSSSLCP